MFLTRPRPQLTTGVAMLGLEGKVGIVTGAGSGIGRAIALRLADARAIVVINDINLDAAVAVCQEIVRGGGRCAAKQADVSDSRQVELMVREVVEEFQTVDLLVNNAGFGQVAPSIADITDEDWGRVLDVNLKGVFNCCRAVVPTMSARRSGRIVNVSSIAGRRASVIAGAHYSAAKAGVLGLTRHLARELAPLAITVNAVCPGVTLTPLVRSQKSAEQLSAIAERIPLGRLGKPDDVAGVVLFLLSDEAAYLTGLELDVSGGALLV